MKWIHFPLHPETPMEGVSLKELFKGREAGLDNFRTHMKSLMEEAGLPYGDRTMTYNSRLAQELGKWADTQPGGDAIHDRLYRAYFVDNVNLSDIDALVRLAQSVGLDANEAKRVLEQREFEQAVDEDWRRSQLAGVTGVPTFASKDLMVVGCQPYEILERFVNHLQKL